MQKSDFYYDLPDNLIAQSPLNRRDSSRLMCLGKTDGRLDHRTFSQLPELLREGDCLVLNDSRVMPARLFGKRTTGGSAEVLLLRNIDNHVWECLTRPGRKTKIGTELFFGDGSLSAVVTGEAEDGKRLLSFKYSGIFLDLLEKLGKMPLPPYIKVQPDDKERYQTVYSREIGSAAAPTAGLHFTHELLDEITARGVIICRLTLHVGLGTFRPVKQQNIEHHKMHEELFVISEETAKTISSVKADGGRVIAVGTTSCRALESNADESGRISAHSGFTDIFIYPGYTFKCVDGLITNFHLPESTLIMLVSAFAGRKNVLNAYNEAISRQYRFFSFGDAMLII